MLFGRPVQLWNGLILSAASLIQVVLVTAVPGIDPVAVATIIGAAGAFLGVLIAFLANQPPTVTEGDTVKVVTPEGEPNRTVTV